MQNYVRLQKTVNTKGGLVPLEEVLDKDKLRKKVAEAPTTDWYRSLFYYPSEAKQYYLDNNYSVQGYKGKAYSNFLFFDFDCSSDLELAKSDAVKLLYKLSDLGVSIEKSVEVFFSGGKGFHVFVPISKELTPDQHKFVASTLLEGLTTADTQIYNTTRLIRIENTKHNKSGLYKIPLEAWELEQRTADQIKELAQKPRHNHFNFIPDTHTDVKFIDEILKDMNKPRPIQVVEADENAAGVRGLDDIDFTYCPKDKPRCIYALEQGVMVEGERNAAMHRLAAYYRNQGLAKEVAYRALKGVAELNARLYPDYEPISKDEIWHTVINSCYNGNFKQIAGAVGSDAKNPLLLKYCNAIKSDTRCSMHRKDVTTANMIKIDEVANSFSSFAKDLDKNRILTGVDFIDNHMKITSGTYNILCGATGSGKTSLALKMMESCNDQGLHCVFFSLDMNKNLVYLKLAQKLTKYSQDQILEIFKNKDKPRIKEITEAISNKYGNTFFDFASTQDINQMIQKVQNIQEEKNCKISLVVVDYASRIAGPYSDSYANAKLNAIKIRDAINDTNAAWLIITQVSRTTSNGAAPLRTKRTSKDSGDWEENADNQINVWRPFMGSEDKDEIMRIYLAKNRMGKELEMPLVWNGAKSEIRDMTDEELVAYRDEVEATEIEYYKSLTGGGKTFNKG